MMGKGFFNAKYLLKMKDSQGLDPEIFIVCSRVRGPGKTTSVGNYVINHFFTTGEKFVLVTRHKKNVGNYAEGVLKGSANMCGGWSVEESVGINGVYSNVYLSRLLPKKNPEDKDQIEKVAVGYVIPLRAAYEIKNISSLFIDSWCSIQDEFILQDDGYLTDEPILLQNLHTSLARGGGKSVRYYPHIMMANCIDVVNPYFLAMGLTGKLQPNTRKYRGDGVVYMRYESSAIAKQHELSGFNRAFKGFSKENEFLDNSWLVESNSLVGKPDPSWGAPTYQLLLHDKDIWLRLGYYPLMSTWVLDNGRNVGLPVYSMGEPEVGERLWDAPGITVRKKLRDRFKTAQLRFRNEQVKRQYLERI